MHRSWKFLFVSLAVAAGICASPGAATATILHNQLTAPGMFGVPDDSTPATYAEPVDDFTVPPGETWTIEGVTALFTAGGTTERVRIYADNGLGTAPPVAGGILFQQDTRTPSVLAPAAGPLEPGRYWVSVQHPPGGGSWITTPVQSGSPAAYDRPGAGCARWTPMMTCQMINEPDLSFAIMGTRTVLPAAPTAGTPVPAKARCKPKKKKSSARAAKKRCKPKKKK